MRFDDPLLPAAPYLTGPDAADVIGAALAAADGRVATLRPNQVIYRPGRELVVSYAATVAWGGRDPVVETLLAATTPSGAPSGTLPVEAEDLEVGVWRYPHDPQLPGLAAAVVPRPVAELLGAPAGQLALAVRTFRPCRRAVVHAVWPDGEAYVKVVPPAEAADLAARHDLLRAGGVPVPAVLAVDEGRGLVALEALGGADLRSKLLNGGSLPRPTELRALIERFAATGLPEPIDPRVSLVDAAPRHASMLARVAPDLAARVERLVERISHRDIASTTQATVHGDLHEAQVRVGERGEIVGVLDVDDAGPGDPLDDTARLLGHLTALGVLNVGVRSRIDRYVRRLRSVLADGADPIDLDGRVGAALIGLATGPFRTQSENWPAQVEALLAAAARWLADENTFRRAS